MSTVNKLSYLNDTKSLLRTSLNKFGSSILSTDTFRSYDTKLNDIYDKLPKITATGQGLTISNVQNGLLDDFKMNGVDLEQDTTETIIINEWEQGDISGSTGDTISDNSTIRTQQYIKVFPNVLYNISRTIYNSFMKFRFYDTNYNFLGTQGNVNITTNVSEDRMTANVSSMQLTINDSSVAYMKISDASNNLNTIYTITTNDTPSPIYPQEIKVVEGRQVITDKGKNKFYLNNNYSANYGEASIEVNNNNSFILRMNKTSSNKQSPCATIEFNASYLKPNTTYTISKKNSNTGYVLEHVGSIRLYTNGSYGNFIDADEYTFTTPGQITSFKILLYLFFDNTTVGNYEIEFYDIQLEEGSTATNYELYHDPVDYNIDLSLENIQLAKIPNTDYKNRIYKNNGNWYFEEKVKKVVLDGSETITIQNIGTDNWYYQLSVNCYKTDQLKQICSHYNNSGIYNSNTYQGIMMLIEGHFVRIRYGEEDTVANFKMWLSNNNVELWYPLINSITTQITNTTLINQLEAISVHTGTNIITISNDNDMIPEIEITRLKELERLS